MPEIRFCDTVKGNFFDNYFHLKGISEKLGCRRYQVCTPQDQTMYFQLPAGYVYPSDWVVNALKIVSFLTGIIPFLCGLGKLYSYFRRPDLPVEGTYLQNHAQIEKPERFDRDEIKEIFRFGGNRNSGLGYAPKTENWTDEDLDSVNDELNRFIESFEDRKENRFSLWENRSHDLDSNSVCFKIVFDKEKVGKLDKADFCQLVGGYFLKYHSHEVFGYLPVRCDWGVWIYMKGVQKAHHSLFVGPHGYHCKHYVKDEPGYFQAIVLNGYKVHADKNNFYIDSLD